MGHSFKMKCLVFCFFLILHQAQGFATKESFGWGLPILVGTKFHTTQIRSALCQVQYDFLLSKGNLSPGASKPEGYSKCPYKSWTQDSFLLANLKQASSDLEDAVAAPDLKSGIKDDPLFHFDSESRLNKTNTRLSSARKKLKDSIKNLESNSVSDIRNQLGKILHTLQDFYSHTNWVEMGKTDINPKIGNGGLGISINNGDACWECESDLSTEQKLELVMLMSSTYYEGVFLVLGYRFDNIFVCKNNIKASGLTSGWYGSEVKDNETKPEGKCSHGGAGDNTALQSATGGINKDSATFVFSPHYDKHDAAADLAVTATIRYLEDLRASVNDDDLFGQVIGIDSNPFMSILIDTTGSMDSSIEAVKAYAQNMVAQEASEHKNVVFYFTPFNDPEYGPVMIFRDPKKLEDYIGTLTAGGGGDIPEKCFAALLDTIRAVPPQTNIYVFTDATSKDPDLFPTILSIASEKKLHINFMMSGENTENGRVSSIQDYKNIAISTDGLYSLFTNPSDLNKTSTIMIQNNWQTISLNSGSWSTNSTLKQFVDVDDSAQAIEISISGDYLDVSFSVKDSSGRELATNDTLILSTEQNLLYRIPAGNGSTPWTTVLNFNSDMTGHIVIRAQSTLEASQILYDESTFLPVQGIRPPVNSSFQLAISCPDCSSIDTIEFGPCGGELTTYTNINGTPSFNWWTISDLKISDSTSLLCTQISGKTTTGSQFQRILSDKIQASTLQLTANLVKDFINIGENATIIYQVKNLATTMDTVQLSVTSPDNVTFIYDETHDIPANGILNGTITVVLNSDLPDSIGIETNVQSTQGDSRQGSYVDLSLLVVDPNQDVSTPVCSVVSNSVSQCGQYSSDSCNSTTYDVVVSFNDTGSGIDHVTYPYGTWNVSNNMFNGNSANVTYIVGGTISCCYNATFFVVGKSSFVSRCEVDLNPSGSPTEETSRTPTEETSGSPTETTTGRPTEKTTGRPTEKTSGRPTEKTRGSSTEKTRGSSTEKTRGSSTEKKLSVLLLLLVFYVRYFNIK